MTILMFMQSKVEKRRIGRRLYAMPNTTGRSVLRRNSVNSASGIKTALTIVFSHRDFL